MMCSRFILTCGFFKFTIHMINLKIQLYKLLLWGIFLLLAGGCAPQVKKPAMPVEISEAFSTTGTAPLSERWWSAFGDDELDSLVEIALTNNFDLQTMWDRLAQTEAIAKKNSAILRSQADLEAFFRRRRQENQGLMVFWKKK